jgi:hypothetical protein
LAATWTGTTFTQTINPVSGTSYGAGSYSNGYKKWTKGTTGVETNSSTATKTTTLTYSNTTTGNSGMTTSVQAVLPTSSSARDNDSIPSSSSQGLTLSGTVASVTTTQYFATTCGSIGTCNCGSGANICSSSGPVSTQSIWGQQCTCSAITVYGGCAGVTSLTCGCTETYCASTCALQVLTSKTGTNNTKTYVRYTLQSYNDSTMGYRPVIVVKKAN